MMTLNTDIYEMNEYLLFECLTNDDSVIIKGILYTPSNVTEFFFKKDCKLAKRNKYIKLVIE